ncbi:hypothetical protein HYFRA_00007775 [Hymenoscyphus fraxineus]|uniref:Rhodopsin domain-containing protein n=1 Tax=Hymenoscyphus fraxineus TaxID=746836 RepID=A0A9N9KMR3_9HELO|nr:hypothetical protein HYFRA_00007775 [Hymenoscyphus fraxineus]
MAGLMANITLSPPPTVIDDSQKDYTVAAVCIILGIIGSACTSLRLGFRFQQRAFGADDWAMLVALFLYIGHTIMAGYVNLNGGIGKPLWVVTNGEFIIWFKGVVGSAFLYPAMTSAIRASIVLFYHRIFSQTVPNFKWAVYVYLALTAGIVVVFSILPATICPTDKFSSLWSPLLRQKDCKSDLYYVNTQISLYSCSVAFDVILLFMPLYPITKLQMPAKKRMGALIMFMLGSSACIAVSYKLAIFVMQMAKYDHIDPRWMMTQLSRVVPPQFDAYGYTFWIPSQVEPTVALIGTSLPAISQALMKLSPSFKKFMATVGSTNRTKSSQGVVTMESKYENLEGPNGYLKGDSESQIGLRDSATNYELKSIDERRGGR